MPFPTTIPYSLGVSRAGLTDLRAQPYTSAGAATGSPISTGFTDLTNGFYNWTGTVPDNCATVAVYSNANPSSILGIEYAVTGTLTTRIPGVLPLLSQFQDGSVYTSNSFNSSSAPSVGWYANIPNTGSSGLSGPIAFTIKTVDSSNAPIGSVAFTVQGVGSGYTSSNSGTFTGGLATSGTYTIIAAPINNVIFSTVTQPIVNGSTITLTGTAVPIPVPTSPDITTVYTVTRKGDGTIAPGALVSGRLISGTKTDGTSWDIDAFSSTSDANGLWTHSAPKGCKLGFIRGKGGLGREVIVTIPLTAGSSYALPEINGPD